MLGGGLERSLVKRSLYANAMVVAKECFVSLSAFGQQNKEMTYDDGFPSTQTVIEQRRPIFFDEAGAPLNVFIDPGAVSNRPKLVRSLRVWFISTLISDVVSIDVHPNRSF